MLAISCRHIDVLASLLQVQSWKLRTKEVPVWTCDLLPLSLHFPQCILMTFLVIGEYRVDPKTCTPNNIWWKFIYNLFISFILRFTGNLFSIRQKR